MPALICDPQAGVTRYEIEVNTVALSPFPSETDGSARYPLDSSFEPGKYTFRLRACGTDNWWGDFSLPFVATKPARAGGLKIIG
jgi:hypothetical protein